MPLLKYSFDQKALNSSLAKCELEELLKTIYSIYINNLKYTTVRTILLK